MTQITREILYRAVDRQPFETSQVLLLANQDILCISEVIQENCVKLKKINLNHNQISKIQNLAQLTSLTNLELGFNFITSTVGMESLLNLIQLNLSHNLIQQISKIGQLKFLTNLNVGYNQITKIDFLENLRELRVLNLSGNLIKKIDFLIFNTKIEELYLQKNQIQQICGKDFQNCPNINILDVSYNEINQTGFVNSLEQLTHLNLSHNRIQVFECVKANSNLQVLDLGSNKLADISIIEYKYGNLTHLIVQDNEILTDFSMKFLFNLDYLIEVEFRENPFYNQEFETNLIMQCEWLEVVNGKEVGKPANFRIKEIKELREELKDMNIDEITFTDLDGNEDDIVTAEKLKAILRQKGMDSSDDEEMLNESKPVEKSALIFKDETELQDFMNGRNNEAMEIRQQFLSIIYNNKRIKSESQFITDVTIVDADDAKSQNNETPQSKQIQATSQSSLKQPNMIIKKIPRQDQRYSIPSKTSILQEISHLKTTQKDEQFLKQIGIVDNNRLKVAPPGGKFNQSSENFNQKISMEQQGYKTMTNTSTRGSSIKTDKSMKYLLISPIVKKPDIRSPSQQTPPLKLPLISKSKQQK